MSYIGNERKTKIAGKRTLLEALVMNMTSINEE